MTVRDHRVVVVVELLVVGVYCAVVVVLALVLVVVMTAMVAAAASGCWFVVVIQVSDPLIALVKSVLSAPSVIPRSTSKRHTLQVLHLSQSPKPLLHLPLPLPPPMMFHLRLALRHQRSLVRQSLPSRQLGNFIK
jgi:hypothetical protein